MPIIIDGKLISEQNVKTIKTPFIAPRSKVQVVMLEQKMSMPSFSLAIPR
jgi:hypothetical protein